MSKGKVLETLANDNKVATEYKLSISSNPNSRRSSFGHDTLNSSLNGNNLSSINETMIDTCLRPQLQELAEAMVTLDGNFTQMNFIHESLIDLNESLSALLYGLMCNSWCVDFPNILPDTSKQLEIKDKLEIIEKEKQELLSALKIKEVHNPPSHQEFAKPITKSIVPIKSFAQPPIFIPLSRQEDEDDNTAASFISNPAANMSARQTIHKESKIRRQSILHTMRKTGGSLPQNTINNAHRTSLGVSATRIVNKRPTLTGNASRNAMGVKKSTKPRKHQSSDNSASRPPFR